MISVSAWLDFLQHSSKCLQYISVTWHTSKSTILESTPRLNVMSVKKTFNPVHVIFAVEFRDNVSTAIHVL